jgi:glutathione S-transferase
LSVQPPVEIFGIPQSNFVRAVRIAIVEKGPPTDITPSCPIHPRRAPFTRLDWCPVSGMARSCSASPRPSSPISTAFGMSGRWGRPPIAEAAEITQWISIVATAVDRTLIRRYVVAHVFPKTADGLPDRAAIEAVLPELRDVFTLLEARLSGGEYLAPNRFTFADALMLR